MVICVTENKKGVDEKMKKNIQKILCVLMILVLAMSFTACGSKKSSSNKDKADDKKEETSKKDETDDKDVSSVEDLTVEEVLTKMSEASEEIKGAAIEGSFVFDVEMAEEAIAMSADFTCESNVDPLKAHMDMDMSMDYAGQSMDMTVELYEVQEDDVIKVYTCVMDQWTCEETDMSDMEFDMSQFADVDFSQFLDYLDKAEVKTEDGEYVIELELTMAKILEILEENGLSEEIEAYESMLPDATLTVEIGVDAESFLPTKMFIMLEMDEFEVEEGQSLAVNEFSINMEYTSYEEADIEVPADVIEEAESNADLYSDDEDWDY